MRGPELYDNRLSAFMLRVQPGGARSYYARFGRNRRVVLGKVGIVAPEDARERGATRPHTAAKTLEKFHRLFRTWYPEPLTARPWPPTRGVWPWPSSTTIRFLRLLCAYSGRARSRCGAIPLIYWWKGRDSNLRPRQYERQASPSAHSGCACAREPAAVVPTKRPRASRSGLTSRMLYEVTHSRPR